MNHQLLWLIHLVSKQPSTTIRPKMMCDVQMQIGNVDCFVRILKNSEQTFTSNMAYIQFSNKKSHIKTRWNPRTRMQTCSSKTNMSK